VFGDFDMGVSWIKVYRLSTFESTNKRIAIFKIISNRTEEKMLRQFAKESESYLDEMMFFSSYTEFMAFKKGMEDAFKRFKLRNVPITMRSEKQLTGDFND